MNTPQPFIENDNKRCEIVFVYYLAPVILRLKPASMFAFEESVAKEFCELSNQMNMQTVFLGTNKGHQYYIFYRENEWRRLLLNEEVQQLLKTEGYVFTPFSLQDIIQKITNRFRSYWFENQKFPHEIGALLGYPIKDVRAYMKEQGQHALCNGYWKVYSEVENAKETFARYDEARKELLHYVLEHSITELKG